MISDDKIPKATAWKNYQHLTGTYGVQLVGWPEERVCNPCNFKTIGQLQRLWNAVFEGECHWELLS
ncbi:hypothetical protein J0673_24775, partial [Vibrio sp. Vb2736]|uniref:hypothetical protein n=1 Tax=Vibrio sp. Vb2736 TaxID=2816075 RepID=UPI001A905CB0